jgi:hypothetical protein
MTPIETDITEYLMWMKIHNYARTTIANREVYLRYLSCPAAGLGIAMATELCAVLPQRGLSVGMGGT